MSEEELLHRLMAEKAIEFEAIHTDRDGSRINVIAKVSLLRDKNGTLIGTVGVIRDITERKRTRGGGA